MRCFLLRRSGLRRVECALWRVLLRTVRNLEYVKTVNAAIAQRERAARIGRQQAQTVMAEPRRNRGEAAVELRFELPVWAVEPTIGGLAFVAFVTCPEIVTSPFPAGCIIQSSQVPDNPVPRNAMDAASKQDVLERNDPLLEPLIAATDDHVRSRHLETLVV